MNEINLGFSNLLQNRGQDKNKKKDSDPLLKEVKSRKFNKLRKALKNYIFNYLTQEETLFISSISKDLQNIFMDKKKFTKEGITLNISAVDFSLFFKIYLFMENLKERTKIINFSHNFDLFSLAKEKFKNILNPDVLMAAMVFFCYHRYQFNKEKKLYFKIENKKSFREFLILTIFLDKEIFFYYLNIKVSSLSLKEVENLFNNIKKGMLKHLYDKDPDKMFSRIVLSNSIKHEFETFEITRQNCEDAVKYFTKFPNSLKKFKIISPPIRPLIDILPSIITIIQLNKESLTNIYCNLSYDIDTKKLFEAFGVVRNLKKFICISSNVKSFENIPFNKIEEIGGFRINSNNINIFSELLQKLPNLKALKLLSIDHMRNEQNWNNSHQQRVQENNLGENYYLSFFKDYYNPKIKKLSIEINLTNRIIKILYENFPNLKKFSTTNNCSLYNNCLRIDKNVRIRIMDDYNEESYNFIFRLIRKNKNYNFSISNVKQRCGFLPQIITLIKKLHYHDILPRLDSDNFLHIINEFQEPLDINIIEKLEVINSTNYLRRYENLKSVNLLTSKEWKYDEKCFQFIERMNPKIIKICYKANDDRVRLMEYISENKKKFKRLQVVLVHNSNRVKSLDILKKKFPNILFSLQEEQYDPVFRFGYSI